MTNLRKQAFKHFRECCMAYLRERLQSAVAEESFELAAIIRDEINHRSASEERCVTVQKFTQYLEDQD